MSARVERCVLLSLLSTGLLAIIATGGAAAASPVDTCDGNTTTIVGGVGDTNFSDTVTLYPGSTLTVGYCPSGEPATSSWLESGDGFERDYNTGDPSTYTVTITGGVETITFSDNLTSGNQSSVEKEIEIIVADSATTTDGTESSLQNPAIKPTYGAFLDAVSETNDATTRLNEKTATLNAEEVKVTVKNISEANKSLSSLEDSRENLTASRSNLLDTIRSARENGAAVDVVAANRTVNAQYTAADENATNATEKYAETVKSETAAPRSTVQLSIFGSLGVGVILGVVSGAAVPLIAARRAREKMRLSRDVSVDLKTAILPTLLGLLAGLIGVVILIQIGITDLLRVIV